VQRDAFGAGPGFGALPQGLGQRFGMGGKVLKEDVLLPEITLHAAGMVEQPRLTGQTQAIKSGEDKQDQGAKAR
jgi:hypothetical protein